MPAPASAAPCTFPDPLVHLLILPKCQPAAQISLFWGNPAAKRFAFTCSTAQPQGAGHRSWILPIFLHIWKVKDIALTLETNCESIGAHGSP